MNIPVNAFAQAVSWRSTYTYIVAPSSDLTQAWGFYENYFTMKPGYKKWIETDVSTIASATNIKFLADGFSDISPTSLSDGAHKVDVTVQLKASSRQDQYINYWGLNYKLGVGATAGDSFLTQDPGEGTLSFGKAAPVAGGGSKIVALHGTYLSQVFLLSENVTSSLVMSGLFYSSQYYELYMADTQVSFPDRPGIIYTGKRITFFTDNYRNIDPNVSFTLSAVPEPRNMVLMTIGLFAFGIYFGLLQKGFRVLGRQQRNSAG